MDETTKQWIQGKIAMVRQYYPIIDSRYWQKQGVLVVFVAFRGKKKKITRKRVPDFFLPSVDRECYSQEVQKNVIQLCFQAPWMKTENEDDIPSPPRGP
jgi:hypothetical protein